MITNDRFIAFSEVHGKASGVPAGGLGVPLGVPDGPRWFQMVSGGPRWCQIVVDQGTQVSEFNPDLLNSKIMQ